MVIHDVFNDNKITEFGGSVIGEGLKVNSTLTELYLSMRRWLCMMNYSMTI